MKALYERRRQSIPRARSADRSALVAVSNSCTNASTNNEVAAGDLRPIEMRADKKRFWSGRSEMIMGKIMERSADMGGRGVLGMLQQGQERGDLGDRHERLEERRPDEQLHHICTTTACALREPCALHSGH